LESHQVDFVSSGEDAIQLLRHFTFDIILLDWELPGISGYEVVHDFRKRGGATPVIFLTGRKDTDSKAAGLDSGADDYMVKSIDPRELSARIRVQLRHSTGVTPGSITIGDVQLDSTKKRVLIKSETARLTRKEFAILEFLMLHSDRAYSSSDLLDSVWTSDSDRTDDAVRQVVRTLRRKLQEAGVGDFIKTRPGGGYTVESQDA
jgi:two-component system, OmpR family, response regulator TctD